MKFSDSHPGNPPRRAGGPGKPQARGFERVHLWLRGTGFGRLFARTGAEPGVALVITLIFLAVITFMAVTFLVVSRRERERVVAQSGQSDAKFAADVALEHVKAWILASAMSQNNSYNIGLFVSTNYENPFGFQNNLPNGYPNNITNVSYNYPPSQGGAPVSANSKDFARLMSNLRILPRVPVFVSTNRNPAFPLDFRFYLDLNRNGVYDTNGLGTNYLNYSGNIWKRNPDGSPVTNFFVGDPEWIGILADPEQSHSPSNQFVARYCFIAIPIGNTLDLNYIHNQAKQPTRLRDGFLRNEGFGSWELNLAAFLHYLNSNVWTYAYNTNLTQPSTGTAFDDATSFVVYRYTSQAPNGGWGNLQNFATLYGKPGVMAFPFDYIDVYSRGPLWTTVQSPPRFTESAAILQTSWPGADNPQHFFTTQDLFNFTNQLPNNLFLSQTSGPSNFVQRLTGLSNSTNFSDGRYLIYDLLKQAAFESAPETNNKINLNFASLGGTNAANYIPWTPVQFFTNAADRLLKDLAGTANVYPNIIFPTNFGVGYIPVYPTNYYTPAVHRMLQLAANIYDATTNRTFGNGSTTNVFPSVFRPTFGMVKNGTSTNIYINGYVEVGPVKGRLANGEFTDNNLKTILSLPENLNQFTPNSAVLTNASLYGIPWVIGARKGLPNLNQFGYQTVSQITRRLQINKGNSATNPRSTWTTNQQYQIGISNIIGFQAWNSYSNYYPRSLFLYGNDSLSMSLMVSNSGALVYSTTLITNITPQTNLLISGNGSWPGFPSPNLSSYLPSFQEFKSNLVFIPDMIYSLKANRLGTTNLGFEPLIWPPPTFALGVTNRMRFVLFDVNNSGEVRVLDYVEFGGLDNGGMDTFRNLTSEMITYDTNGFWSTNFTKGNLPAGPINQIQLALSPNPPPQTWQNAQIGNPTVQSMQAAITAFQNFMNGSDTTNLVMQVPFTPTAEYYQKWAWQANDPLVHYTLRDMNPAGSATNGSIQSVSPVGPIAATSILPSIGFGAVSPRYSPWGQGQNAYASVIKDISYKDPLVGGSDFWNFPTNKMANIGWLGRVHRGTPWQTIYMKSTPIANHTTWTNWTGNSGMLLWLFNPQGQVFTFPTVPALGGVLSEPTNDWRLFDYFTTAPNDNATRGRLSINQTNMAAWAAVLHGAVVLTNTASSSPLSASYNPLVIDPNFNDFAFSNIVAGINNRRQGGTAIGNVIIPNYPGLVFTNLGDILSVPELTVRSPFINTNNNLTDDIYERLPQQIMSLLKVGEARYLVFCYGQSLKPADRSVYMGSPGAPTPPGLFGIVTNYQVTGEIVTRAVVRVTDQSRPRPGQLPANLVPPAPPQVIVENFSVLPPE